MMNAVNKLIWPSPLGVGVVGSGLWDQNVEIAITTKNLERATIIDAAPPAGAYTNQFAEAANAVLAGEGLDTTGEGFTPITVVLREGGN
jgi:NitT/TauT family transport system substrate-binding protein